MRMQPEWAESRKGGNGEERKGEGILKGVGGAKKQGRKETKKKRGANTQGKKIYLADVSLHRFISGICLLSKYMC